MWFNAASAADAADDLPLAAITLAPLPLTTFIISIMYSLSTNSVTFFPSTVA